jgi:hypothetical protein
MSPNQNWRLPCPILRGPRFSFAGYGCCTRTMTLDSVATAMPSRPLLLKSPTATDVGPEVKATGELDAGVKVPSPFPRRIDTVLSGKERVVIDGKVLTVIFTDAIFVLSAADVAVTVALCAPEPFDGAS